MFKLLRGGLQPGGARHRRGLRTAEENRITGALTSGLNGRPCCAGGPRAGPLDERGPLDRHLTRRAYRLRVKAGFRRGALGLRQPEIRSFRVPQQGARCGRFNQVQGRPVFEERTLSCGRPLDRFPGTQPAVPLLRLRRRFKPGLRLRRAAEKWKFGRFKPGLRLSGSRKGVQPLNRLRSGFRMRRRNRRVDGRVETGARPRRRGARKQIRRCPGGLQSFRKAGGRRTGPPNGLHGRGGRRSLFPLQDGLRPGSPSGRLRHLAGRLGGPAEKRNGRSLR
jgi:hypothetical protein